jgi:hypothetical protein
MGNHVIPKVLMVMTMKSNFCDVMPSSLASLVEIYQNFYQTTWCHIPEDSSLHKKSFNSELRQLSQ